MYIDKNNVIRFRSFGEIYVTKVRQKIRSRTEFVFVSTLVTGETLIKQILLPYCMF